jgi:hypothetical protein
MTNAFDLNIRHLRAISAIVRHGSMSAAADAVSLSQPALTQGLAKLERQLGAALFERRPDGMSATPEGQLASERVDAALNHLTVATRATARGGARSFARPELLMTATQLRAFLAVADACRSPLSTARSATSNSCAPPRWSSGADAASRCRRQASSWPEEFGSRGANSPR